ncbi:MAG: histidine phosphatase family protein [Lachnospiraceae bacterium]|nr:histidine phosphatase family protein [Lachnospiraceae bacterium]
MRLLFVRHGDPDYEHDALTEKGRREAELLSRVIPEMGIREVYISPLGRARQTAEIGLQNVTVEKTTTVPWLMEFMTDLNLNQHPELRCAYGEDTPLLDGGKELSGFIGGHKSYYEMLHPGSVKAYLPDEQGKVPTYAPRIIWDVLPSYAKDHPELYDCKEWLHSDLAIAGHLEECSEYVFDNFDAMLADHGYRRDGLIYDAVAPNRRTVACFCHLGLECLLASHLMHVSPFTLWMHFAFVPSSVTEFITEERQEGIAIFRARRLGDISHLVQGHEEPSFAARFCETFDGPERH